MLLAGRVRNVDARDKFASTPLMAAAREGNAGAAAVLLALGADQNVRFLLFPVFSSRRLWKFS